MVELDANAMYNPPEKNEIIENIKIDNINRDSAVYRPVVSTGILGVI